MAIQRVDKLFEQAPPEELEVNTYYHFEIRRPAVKQISWEDSETGKKKKAKVLEFMAVAFADDSYFSPLPNKKPIFDSVFLPGPSNETEESLVSARQSLKRILRAANVQINEAGEFDDEELEGARVYLKTRLKVDKRDGSESLKLSWPMFRD